MSKLKLFLVTQKECAGYSMYNSIIVCAIDKPRARIRVKEIGIATIDMKPGVIVAS